MTIEEITERLRANRAQLDQYGVGEVLVFGSQARGDARVDSDVDLIVEFQRALGLVEYMDLIEMFKVILGRHVDVVSRRSLDRRPDKSPYILAEAKKVA
jgi:predicted nucleotidyltransferase